MFTGRSDIVENQLVQTIIIIFPGFADGITNVPGIDEAYTLYELAIANIETGDDSFA